MQKEIFISHSSKDSHQAEEICSFLESKMYKCWIAPRDVKHGEDYDQEIIKGIENSRICIVLLSINSNISDHVRRELALASDLKIDIIPIRIEEIEPSSKLKLFVSLPQRIDVFSRQKETGLFKLLEIIQAIIPVRDLEPSNEFKAELIKKIDNLPEEIKSVALAPDGKRLVSCHA